MKLPTTRNLFAVIVIAMLCSTAFATSAPTPTPAPSNTANANSASQSNAGAVSKSTSTSKSSARQSQAQTANGGSAQQSQNANNEGNEQSTAITSNYEDRLQAPAVSAPAVYASGPCAYGWSAGLSIPGGGLSGGKSKPDTDCNRREVARVLAPLNPSLALKVLCADPLVAAVAAEGDCDYVQTPVVLTSSPEPKREDSATDDAITREEVDTKIDRAFKQSVSK